MSRSTVPPYQRRAAAGVDRHAAQHTLELIERVAQGDAAAGDLQLADRRLVRAGALLDDGDGGADAAKRLEKAQQDYGIGEVGDVDGLPHLAEHAVLRDGEECRGTAPVEVLQQ